jgi:hypothetical protein
MLRFPCPTCDKTIKIPESFAGKKVSCPRCHGVALAPTPEPQVDNLGESPGLFASMSPRLRLAAASVAIVGGVGLLTSILRPLLGEMAGVTRLGGIVAGCSFIVLLAMLHGHGTGCPCCGAWWSRWKVKSEVGDRELFQRDGANFGRSMTRTEFRCDRCGHTWSVVDSEEYPLPERSPKPSQDRRLRG